MSDSASERLLVWQIVAAALAAMVLVLGGHSAAASADSGVQIDIIDDAPSPSPSSSSPVATGPGDGSTSSGGGSGGSSSSGGGPGGGSGNSTPGSSGGGADSPSPATSVPGVRTPFVVSALTAIPSSGLAPFGGRIELELTVHNLSAEPLDAESALRLENIFGGRLATRTVEIPDLQPGEKRLVRAVFEELGQEGLVKAVAVVTPPDSIDGQDMAPVQREVWTFLTPWIVVAGCLLVGAGVGVPFLLRRWRM